MLTVCFVRSPHSLVGKPSKKSKKGSIQSVRRLAAGSCSLCRLGRCLAYNAMGMMCCISFTCELSGSCKPGVHFLRQHHRVVLNPGAILHLNLRWQSRGLAARMWTKTGIGHLGCWSAIGPLDTCRTGHASHGLAIAGSCPPTSTAMQGPCCSSLHCRVSPAPLWWFAPCCTWLLSAKSSLLVSRSFLRLRPGEPARRGTPSWYEHGKTQLLRELSKAKPSRLQTQE